jgi:hypothetical protein
MKRYHRPEQMLSEELVDYLKCDQKGLASMKWNLQVLVSVKSEVIKWSHNLGTAIKYIVKWI